MGEKGSYQVADKEKQVELSQDADEALGAIQSANEGVVIEIDEATNKRLLRTIDRHLLPLMCVTYGFQFLDKLVLSYAAVMGMIGDVGIEGNQYQWLAGVFYFGYLAWEFPTNWLMQRLPLAKYSAFGIIMWGMVQCAHAGVVNYPGAIVARLFLGAFEAAVTPGFAFITAQWYTREEQNIRTAIWFSCNGVAQVFGAFLAYGILRGIEAHGSTVAAWRWLYLATGIMTVLLGIAFYLYMPDNQLNARWMTKEDRLIAIHRIRVNQQGIGNRHFKPYQFVEALRDPMSWAFAFFAIMTCIPGGGISNFFNQLTFGYNTAESMLLGAPAGGVFILSILLNGYFGSRFNARIAVSSGGLWLSIIGMLLIICLPLNRSIGRLIGYYLCWCFCTGFVTVLCLIGTNIAGYTKTMTVAAIYLTAYCTGYIIGPQTFQQRDAPVWRPAQITLICCWFLAILDLYFIAWWYKRENKKKAAIRASAGYASVSNQEWFDFTDRENSEFVYTI